MKFMHRRALGAAMAIGMIVALGACSAEAEPEPDASAPSEGGDDLVTLAQAEGSVTMYTGWLESTIAGVEEAFEAEYGITVNIPERLSSAALSQRIDADVRSTGSIGADVLLTTDQALSNYLGTEGLTAQLSADEFSELDDVFVQDSAVVCAVGTPVIAWNTDAMGEDFDISSWDDALDSEIGSEILLPDPRGSAAWANTWSAIYNSDQLGEDFIGKIGGSGYQPVASSLVGVEQLVAGQGGVQMFGPMSIFQPAQDAGQPIEVWYPVDPSPVFFNFCSQVAESEHPNAGKLFLQWLMSPAGQKVTNGPELLASPLGDVEGVSVPMPEDFQAPPGPEQVQEDLPEILELLGFN